MQVTAPFQNPVLIGHERALEQINAAYASGRMPHAWLITGIEGIGKATLAYHMAHFALSAGENPLGHLEMQHPIARLIAAQSHPDLFVLQRAQDPKTGQLASTISAQDARGLSFFLQKTATQGLWRMAVIDGAQTLNRFGQNAILKAIEEPPPNTLIVLTATSVGALLPTIRSRCRVLPLNPLEEAEMRTVLMRCAVEVDESTLSRLAAWSEGSPGLALRILETETLPLFEETLALLREGAGMPMNKVHALADKIARKEGAARFDVLSTLVLQALRVDVRGRALKRADSRAFLPPGVRLDRSLELWEKIRDVFASAQDANLDRKLAFVNAMVQAQRHYGSGATT